MNSLSLASFACLMVLASAKPSGHGLVIAHGHGYGGWGDGGWGDGGWGDGAYSNVVHGNGATTIGASAGHSAVYGAGAGLGLGAGVGFGNGVGHGHGVVVSGPPTAPATIVGPGLTGSVHADGLWGPTHAHGHGYGYGHGHHW